MIYNKYYFESLDVISQDLIDICSSLRKQTILILGASGLICSYIVDLLMYINEKYEYDMKVIACGRNKEKLSERFSHWNNCSELDFLEVDIISNVCVNDDVKFIINGASNANPSIFAKDPIGTLMGNILGMYNVLESVKSHKNSTEINTVYISSGEVYGIMPDKGMVPENYSGYVDTLSIRSAYPIGKRAAENLCIDYIKQHNLNIRIARPCHIYGATMTETDTRALSAFIRNVSNGQNIVMKSKGEQIRSHCFVGDCASAIIRILLIGVNGKAYNISDKKSILSISEAANIIAEEGNKTVKCELPTELEKKGYTTIPRQVLDSTLLEELGWSAKYSFKNGIKNTLQVLNKECK